MILPFSKQLNGKTTYFVERIWEGLLRNYFQDDKEYIEFMNAHKKRFGIDWDWFPNEHNRLTNPKIHTIREDKKERWQIGTKIDFFINVRQKNMFRFATRVSVVSTQKFQIKYHINTFLVYIDEKLFFFGNRDFTINEHENHTGMLELAQNDGFDTIEDFCAYFNEDFTGKLIHWTDKRY
jgi:hypothetical protein